MKGGLDMLKIILSLLIAAVMLTAPFIGCSPSATSTTPIDTEYEPTSWDHYFDNGSGGWDVINGVVLDPNDNVYITGYGKNIVGDTTFYDWWIKKFDMEGTEDSVNWDIGFDNGADGQDISYCIEVDSSNNVYVVGYGTNLIGTAFASTGQDWLIKKFDDQGNELDFGGSSLPSCGGGTSPCSTNAKDQAFDGNSATDNAWAVATDLDNNVYMAGYGDHIVSGSSFHDWWIKKFDSSGNELDFGGSLLPASGSGISPCSTNVKDQVFDAGTDDADIVMAIVTDTNGNVYVVGFGKNIVDAFSDLDWWIKKFDSSGNELDFGGSGYPGAGSGVSPCTTNGKDAVFDNSGGTGIVDDRAYAAAFDSSGSLYVVGEGWDLVNGSSRNDWWIKKFDRNGVEDSNWEKKIDGGNNDWEGARSVTVDSWDNVYVAGYGYNLVTDSSGYDWWVKKYNSQGVEDTAWEKKYDGNAESDQAYGIAIDSYDCVYVVGYGSNIQNETSSYDLWIHKFTGD
jgi:uncharacterized delta-60 repeat protein